MSRGWVMEKDHEDEGEIECECECEGDCKCPSEDSYEAQVKAMKAQVREEMINKLAAEWNEIHTQIEHRSWRSREEREDEADYLSEMLAERQGDAEYQALQKNPDLTKDQIRAIRDKVRDDFEKEIRLREEKDHMRLEVIQGLLSDLGARMMRPYEHWNEEERYMEYMENRYDERNGYDY